jgi:hypothetical protein
LGSTCGFYFLIVPSRPEELRRTVADRVAQRVAGRGVPRAAIDSAVTSVLKALDARTGAPSAVGLGAAGAPATVLVAAVTARSLPDLASRLRSALGREGLTVGSIGIAAAGLHHVATLEIPSSGRPALEAACRALGAQLSIVSEGDAA